MIALAGAAAAALVAVLAGGLLGSVSRGSATRGRSGSDRSLAAAYARLPLSFEPNRGQFDRRVLYAARGPGYTLFLTHRGAVMTLAGAGDGRSDRQAAPTASKSGRQGVVRIGLAGASPRARVTPVDRLPGKVNYMIGDNRSDWHTDIPTYSAVRYRDVWPGIGGRFYGRNGRLEYDFDVTAGADPGQIALTIGGNGKVALQRDGSLLVKLPSGRVRQLVPHAYQRTAGGGRQPVSARYVLHTGGRVTVSLGRYDHRRPLVVDPALLYATFIGGSGPDEAMGVSTTPDGDAWITGDTGSSNFPHPGGGDGTFGMYQDAFVAKLNAANQLVYASYLGGIGPDFGRGVSATADGGAWVTGNTQSDSFPVTGNPIQPSRGGGIDAFAARLTSTGHLAYATYLGGGSLDEGLGVSSTPAGGAWITGDTQSTNFPHLQGGYGGVTDVFMVKLAANGALDVGRYLGGSQRDVGSGVSTTAGGGAWVTGYTEGDFPVTGNPAQGTYGGGTDAFAARVTDTGNLVYATYLGGSASDLGAGISTTPDGGAWITGETASANFPVGPHPFDGTVSGVDAFAVKLTAGGDRAAGTFLGGTGAERGLGVAATSDGGAWITGETASNNFPVTNGTVLQGPGGDAFAVKLTAGGGRAFATYIGGHSTFSDIGYAVSATAGGGAWIAGRTDAGDFPITPGAAQSTLGGIQDAFVVRLGEPILITKTASLSHVAPGHTLTYTLHINNRTGAPLHDAHVTDDLSGVLDDATWAHNAHASSGTVHFTAATHTLHWTGDLHAGQTVTVTYSVHVHTGLTGGLLTNAAESPNGAVCMHAPSRLSPCTTVTPIVPAPAPAGAPHLVLTKVASVTHALPGEQVTYQLLVRNRGHAAATGVVIEDTAPPGLHITHAVPDQGHCRTGATVTCHLGTIHPGGEAIVQLTARFATDASGTVANTANVRAHQPSIHPADQTSTSHVRIISAAGGGGGHNQGGGHSPGGGTSGGGSVATRAVSDLVVTGTASHRMVRRGAQVLYTFTVTNRGPDAAHDVQVRFAFRLPARIAAVLTSLGNCTQTRPIVCTLHTIPANGHVTIRIHTTETVAGDQLVSADATSASHDPRPPTATARVGVRVTAGPGATRRPPPPAVTG